MPKTSGLQKRKPLVEQPAPLKVYSFAEYEIYKEEERLKHKVNAVAYPKKKIFAN